MLIYCAFATHRGPFWYFWGAPKGPNGVGGISSLSESFQGVYEGLLKKIQTRKISRTYIISVSIWLKSSFAGYLPLLAVLLGTFGGPEGLGGSSV